MFQRVSRLTFVLVDFYSILNDLEIVLEINRIVDKTEGVIVVNARAKAGWFFRKGRT